jgi:hypothetical protein
MNNARQHDNPEKKMKREGTPRLAGQQCLAYNYCCCGAGPAHGHGRQQPGYFLRQQARFLAELY